MRAENEGLASLISSLCVVRLHGPLPVSPNHIASVSGGTDDDDCPATLGQRMTG